MLINLKIKNYRSIRDEIVLDMSKYYRNDSSDLKNNSFNLNGSSLIRSSILYGRNASGKSNILKAFDALQFLVCESDKFKHGEYLKPYEPCLLYTSPSPRD